jgi:hypothetical protein
MSTWLGWHTRLVTAGDQEYPMVRRWNGQLLRRWVL